MTENRTPVGIMSWARRVGRRLLGCHLLEEKKKGRQWPRRIEYQAQLLKPLIREGDRILDIGSGSDPFPWATHLCDLHPEATAHRFTQIQLDDRPFVVADVQSLPYGDKEFDFVYCCHVLEHVDDPITACREIQRVGKSGYIETPARCKDILFAWARGMHKWHVVGHGKTLVFFEYSNRELDGIRSTYVSDSVHSEYFHPLQDVVFDNCDILNVMYTWINEFRVEVFRQGSDRPEFYDP